MHVWLLFRLLILQWIDPRQGTDLVLLILQ